MAENDKRQIQENRELPASDSAPALPASPIKTPMYKAKHAERYLRQGKIKYIQEKTGRRLLCYVAGSLAPMTRDDVIGMVELLHNVPRGSNVDLLLHTVGGDIVAAEKIVFMLRNTVHKVEKEGQMRVIVPDFAKSAGTLIALAANKIIMSDSSELGPIDPQFRRKDADGDVKWLSILSYLKAYHTLSVKLRASPDDLPAKLMLSKLDPTTVFQFEAISQRARQLAESHLNRWMLQQRRENSKTFTEIAADLMNTERWPDHGQMISWEDAKEIGLEVEYLPPEDEDWRDYWSLYCHQRWAIKDDEKLFETDYASLSM